MLPVIITGTSEPTLFSPAASPLVDDPAAVTTPSSPLGVELQAIVEEQTSFFHSAVANIEPFFGIGWQFVVIGMLFLGCVLFGIAFGKHKLLSLMLAAYVSTVVYFSGVVFLDESSFEVRFIFYILALSISFVIISLAFFRHRSGGIDRRVIAIIGHSAALTGFFISTVLTVVLPERSWATGGFMAPFFTSVTSRVVWSVLPLLSFLFFKKSHV